jgi:hypothetical protein
LLLLVVAVQVVQVVAEQARLAQHLFLIRVQLVVVVVQVVP